MSDLPTEYDTSSSICPFLGKVSDGSSADSPVEYPSFENRCLVSERREGLMLTDQATFCLSRGHRYCPRFVANRAALSVANPDQDAHLIPHRARNSDHIGYSSQHDNIDSPLPGLDSTLDSMLVTDSLQDIEAEIQSGFRAQTTRGRQWGWFGAALIFMICLLCGGASAAYIGWQLVNTNFLAVQPGDLDMLAAYPTPAPPQVYFVVTATTDPGTAPQNDVGAAMENQALPQAVTPTPLRLGTALQPTVGIQSQPSNVQVQPSLPQLTQSQANIVPAATQPRPATAIESNIDLQIPTRRPTPVFDVPTSTTIPLPTEPTATATPIPILGPPIVIFAADDSSLLAGKCTNVSWHVENVREVYYENLGVDGHGVREECVDDRDGEYTLTIVLPDGSTRTYTTTVEMLEPTNTPAPTLTFTPAPEATATWTPVIPTDTPTPDVQYGAALAVEGQSDRTCTANENCEIGLLVTNSSMVVDTLTVVFSERGPWNSQLCRMDSVCSESELALVNVGPGNTAFIKLVVNVPGETDKSSNTIGIMVLSEGSGRTKGSSTVTVTVSRSTEGE